MTPIEDARDLISYIDGSPSPFHACAATATRLEEAGWARLDPQHSWADAPARSYVVRGGSLVAWAGPPRPAPPRAFRIVGAHTDSPNLRIKPRPDTGGAGLRQLGIEVYGGALLNSWLDRDLGLSGRVTVRKADGHETRLLRIDRPLLRVPQLAIHLDGDIAAKGLRLDKQVHLTPLWATGRPTEGEFRAFLSTALGGSEVLAWDLMTHDLTPGTLLGLDEEFVSAPRIDDLASCWAATSALRVAADVDGLDATPVVCLFDHEEVGSVSADGADGRWLATVLERIVLSSGGDREDLHRALAGSSCVSADGAHATHPNYAERHEPEHRVHLNEGPVLKTNANARYATEPETAAAFALACDRAGVPHQHFVSRNDLPCGSTIGPVTAARLGIPTVDVGLPQLAMHSARELCGRHDPELLRRALSAYLTGP